MRFAETEIGASIDLRDIWFARKPRSLVRQITKLGDLLLASLLHCVANTTRRCGKRQAVRRTRFLTACNQVRRSELTMLIHMFALLHGYEAARHRPAGIRSVISPSSTSPETQSLISPRLSPQTKFDMEDMAGKTIAKIIRRRSQCSAREYV